MKPKIFLFDVGHVVLNADEALTFAFLENLGVPKQPAESFFSHREYLEFARGNMSGQDFYRVMIERYLKTPLTYQQVVQALGQHLCGVNAEVLEMVQRLPKERVAFATDTNEWQTAKERQFIELGDFGQHIFRSFELHKIKTDDGYLLEIAHALGESVENIVLVDDDAKNVLAAQAVGMQGLVYKNPAQLRTYLAGQTS